MNKEQITQEQRYEQSVAVLEARRAIKWVIPMLPVGTFAIVLIILGTLFHAEALYFIGGCIGGVAIIYILGLGILGFIRRKSWYITSDARNRIVRKV